MNEVGWGENVPRKNDAGDILMSVHHVTIDEAEKRIAELFKLAVQGEEIEVDNGCGKKIMIVVRQEGPFRKQETLSRWDEYEETGDTISNEAMEEWLDSWGTEDEKPSPGQK